MCSDDDEEEEDFSEDNNNKIKETNPDDGYNNFARVTIHVSKMDVLLLHHLGHRRIEFKLGGKRPIHQWLAS